MHPVMKPMHSEEERLYSFQHFRANKEAFDLILVTILSRLQINMKTSTLCQRQSAYLSSRQSLSQIASVQSHHG